VNLSLGNRILLTIVSACAVCTISSIFIARYRIQENGEAALTEKSRAILSRAEVARDYVAKMGILDELLKQTLASFPDGKLSPEQKKKIINAVPIAAAFSIGGQAAEAEHYRFRILAEKARNKDNQATDQEKKILTRFRDDSNLKEIVENSEDGNYRLVYRPVRLTKSDGCLNCHGDPASSPWKNGKDILGYDMENRADNDLWGAFAIISSSEPVRVQTASATMTIVAVGGGFTLLAMLIAFFVVRAPIGVLKSIMLKLNLGSESMVDSSGHIALSSSDLASAVAIQGSALQATLVSVDEINSTVQHNAETAGKSREIAARNKVTVSNGKQVVSEMIQAIDNISDANSKIYEEIDRSNKEISEITKVIADIGEKTNVINEIVFQTKLLSFNASVEAARAGEHGKGFAVVAEEVGNLAQMSGNAAREITEMLQSSIERVDEIVNRSQARIATMIKEGDHKVRSGTETANRCGEVFDVILNDALAVNSMVEGIAVATKQQSEGVSEISRSMSQLDSVSSKTTNASRDTARIGEQFESQAEELKEIVVELRRVIEGHS
jgi:methyl-accepting chemotaxis protein